MAILARTPYLFAWILIEVGLPAFALVPHSSFEHAGVLLNCQAYYIALLFTTFQWFPIARSKSKSSELPGSHSFSLSSDISAVTLPPPHAAAPSLLASTVTLSRAGQCVFLFGVSALTLSSLAHVWDSLCHALHFFSLPMPTSKACTAHSILNFISSPGHLLLLLFA